MPDVKCPTIVLSNKHRFSNSTSIYVCDQSILLGHLIMITLYVPTTLYVCFYTLLAIRVGCDHHFFIEKSGYQSVLDAIPGIDSEYGHKNDGFEKFQGAHKICCF